MSDSVSIQMAVEKTTVDRRSATLFSILREDPVAQAVDEDVSQKLLVDNLAVDVAVSLAGVTSTTFLILTTTKTISVKLNGSTTALIVTNFLAIEGTITALTVSNSSGSSAYIELYAYSKPVV